MGERLLLFETTCDGGALERVYLERSGQSLGVTVVLSAVDSELESGEPEPLPEGALEAVLRRYGKPLADDVEVKAPPFALPGGASLSAFRYLPRFDVIARDYVLFRPEHGEALAALAAPVSAALRYLARAQRSAT